MVAPLPGRPPGPSTSTTSTSTTRTSTIFNNNNHNKDNNNNNNNNDNNDNNNNNNNNGSGNKNNASGNNNNNNTKDIFQQLDDDLARFRKLHLTAIENKTDTPYTSGNNTTSGNNNFNEHSDNTANDNDFLQQFDAKAARFSKLLCKLLLTATPRPTSLRSASLSPTVSSPVSSTDASVAFKAIARPTTTTPVPPPCFVVNLHSRPSCRRSPTRRPTRTARTLTTKIPSPVSSPVSDASVAFKAIARPPPTTTVPSPCFVVNLQSRPSCCSSSPTRTPRTARTTSTIPSPVPSPVSDASVAFKAIARPTPTTTVPSPCFAVNLTSNFHIKQRENVEINYKQRDQPFSRKIPTMVAPLPGRLPGTSTRTSMNFNHNNNDNNNTNSSGNITNFLQQANDNLARFRKLHLPEPENTPINTTDNNNTSGNTNISEYSTNTDTGIFQQLDAKIACFRKLICTLLLTTTPRPPKLRQAHTLATMAAPLSKTDPAPASPAARPTPPAAVQIHFYDHLVSNAYSKKKKNPKKTKKKTSRPVHPARLPRARLARRKTSKTNTPPMAPARNSLKTEQQLTPDHEDNLVYDAYCKKRKKKNRCPCAKSNRKLSPRLEAQ